MEFDKSNFGNYATNRDLEAEDGVWLKFPGDRRICVLRAGGANRRFSRRYATLIKPHRREQEKGTLDQEISEKIIRELYAETVVLDWEGINDAKGRPVPCTVDNVREFLKAFPEVLSDLIEYAGEASTFVADEIEEAKDTLGKPPSGEPSGEKSQEILKA